MDDDLYFEFCQRNRKLRIERTAEGEIVIMSPVGLDSGYQEFEAGRQLGNWAEKDGRGQAFGASVEFILPNRAGRAPDACWISNVQLEKLDSEESARFPHICPEFVIEVLSPSDRLTRVRAKMQEWIDNGAQLGWLIDKRRPTVTVYRPDRDPEELQDPELVTGEGPVEGFQLAMKRIWRYKKGGLV